MICFYKFINKKHSIYLLVYFLMLKFAGVIFTPLNMYSNEDSYI